MFLKGVKYASAVPDTHYDQQVGVDEMLPEFRLHRMTQWEQRVVIFHGT